MNVTFRYFFFYLKLRDEGVLPLVMRYASLAL